MSYRIIYTLSNIELDLNIMKSNNIKRSDNQDDIKVLFTRDVLHVVNNQDYEEIKSQKYMYGFIIDNPTNIINKISGIFKFISTNLSDSIISLDTGSMKYLNSCEVNYYASNKFLIDKLFTVEINSSEYHTVYQTKGLKSLGIKEIKLSTNKYHDVNTYNKFKSYISNSIANGKFELFMFYGDVNTIDEEQLMDYEIKLNSKLEENKHSHLINNYLMFVKMFSKYHDNKGFKFLINNQIVNGNIPSEINSDIIDYKIVTDEITYDKLNIFYANKYLKINK